MNIDNLFGNAKTKKIKFGEQKQMEQKPKDTGLQKDTFEHEERRSAPNFAITKDDLGGLRVGAATLIFSEEDQKKMDAMNEEERQEYKIQLIKKGQFKVKHSH